MSMYRINDRLMESPRRCGSVFSIAKGVAAVKKTRYLLRFTGFWLLASCFASSSLSAQEPFDGDTAFDADRCHHDIEYGSPRPVIDAVGTLIGIPDKLLLWDRRAKNHHVSHATSNSVNNYLSYRRLHDVKIRVNQYDPVGEWRRLIANDRIAAPWKYTFGLLKHAKYIFVPGRIFGRDEYNPYTNTVSLYSDMPSLGLAEAAYAHDIRNRQFPGTYAAVQTLPLVAMWHETLATDEVINYVAIHATPNQLHEVRRDLYARYGIALGGEVSSVLPDGGLVIEVIGAASGHTLASIQNQYE